LKKLFIGSVLLILLLLSAAYLAVNSPYVIDKVARKFAPEYHFSYDRIVGNPLKGIVLENLYYKKSKLARQIRIRINPYALLRKRLNVSRLMLLDVDVGVLEEVIREFAVPSGAEEPTESSGTSLPLDIELNDIRLTLLPFERYGVRVGKEELAIDSIEYDSGRFNVGNLRQSAETSLGTVELEGTYHERFLDVEFLAVEDLDLTRLRKLLDAIGVTGEGEAESDGADGEDNETVAASGPSAGEDIFLPRRIHAKKLWVTLKPYTVDRMLRLEWAQVEGSELAVDLEERRLTGGRIRTDLRTDLGNARLRLAVGEGRITLEEGVVDSVDLERILALLSSRSAPAEAEPGTGETRSPQKGPGVSEPLDRVAFVPPLVTVERLRVELKPGRIEGIDYGESVLKLRRLEADLHENRLQAEAAEAYLDTPQAHLYLDAGIDDRAIRIRRLDVKNVDLEALSRLGAGDRNRTGNNANGSSGTGSARNRKGITLPFVPSVVELEEGSVELKPFALDPLRLDRATASLEGVRFDLTKLLLSRGAVKVDLRSNLAAAVIEGTIRDNEIVLNPQKRNEILLKKALFETFGLPLRAEAFSPIRLSGSADEKEADLKLAFDARKIMADQNASFNVDINRSVTTARFRFADGTFMLEHESRMAVPQAPKIVLRAKLFDEAGTIRYNGELDAGKVKIGNPKIEKMLGTPRVGFEGDLNSLRAKLDAGLFVGTFVSPDLKKGRLELGTKKPLLPADYVTMPEKLGKAAVTLKAITPIDFTKPLPLDTNLTLRSNLANIDGVVRYDGNLSTTLVTRFPKKSLLAAFDPKLRLSAVDPLTLVVDREGERWKLEIKSRKIGANVDYALDSDRIEGELKVAGTRIKIEGEPKKVITATVKSPSVKQLISGITDIYKVEIPRLDGDVALTLKVDKLSGATLELKSKQFVPDAAARIKSPIKNIRLLLGADLNTRSLILKKYQLETAGMKLFATKPSRLKFQKERVLLEAFWLNDSLKLTGYYDLQKARGEVSGKASRFHVDHENAKLNASIDLKAKIIGEKIDLKGRIIILGGNVMYDIEAKHYATDEDIVIVQHRKKNEESFFRKNVQLNLYVEAKRPLLFKQKDVYVELKPQLSILKGFDADLQMMGSVALAEGGYYTFEGKRFVLRPSSINFTGRPTLPLLDINLVYRRYSRTVYITVTGVATEPSLNFSSDPYMTRDQILSFILFDTVDSGENAGDMLTMVGGGIAKSILGNIGLKVDTLVLTREGFEVGKKITDKITILYDQKKEPKVIVRIQHSKRTETDISIGSESQSVDIIYKREF
jgi:translocation and assembly module TamB